MLRLVGISGILCWFSFSTLLPFALLFPSLLCATVDHDDPYFYGHKIIHYPDESKQLHKELVGDENCATMASWLLFVPILELTPLKPGFGISSEITTDRLTIIMTRTMMKPNPSARPPYSVSRS
jgi:hypothetical protein